MDEEGVRKALAKEVVSSEKGAAYASLLRSPIDRNLTGVEELVGSDEHEAIKAAVAGTCRG